MKKVFALFTALLLCMMLAIPAYADAWLPPTDDGGYNEALTKLPADGGACRPLNVFLSNYAEANLAEFNDEIGDSYVLDAMLKHFELNPAAYPDDVACYTDGDATYMRIDGGKFEERALALFGRSLAAEACPGYLDGDIFVTADNFGAPVKVFAHAVFCGYEGARNYYAYFEVYALDSSVDDCYALTDPAMTEGVRQIGRGEATFIYEGDTQTTEFHSNDFRLDSFQMDAVDIPYTEENLPYIPAEEPVQAETPEQVTLPSETVEKDAPETPAAESGIFDYITIVLVIAGIVLIAVAVTAVILVKWRKKS